MFNFQVNVWFDPVVALIVILSGPETKANPLPLIKTEIKSVRFMVIICQFIVTQFENVERLYEFLLTSF